MFNLFKKKVSSTIKNISKKISKEGKVEKKGMLEKITKKVTEKELSEDLLDKVLWDLDLVLLENNVASEVSKKIIEDIKVNLKGKSVKRKDTEKIIENSLRKTLKNILDNGKVNLKAKKKPTLFLFLGFNGSGKTTSIAKFGNYLLKKNKKCIFAAGDTYRAASIEQLEEHGKRLGIKVIKHRYGGDPAAVIFDAVKHAKSKNINYVLADTAGRSHMNKNLMDELKKIVNVNNPDLNFLVVEAIAGNDVVEQAKIFNEVGINGIILTKWDIDEKGGTALSLTYTLKKPIVFIGDGQEYKDFKEFKVEEVLKNII